MSEPAKLSWTELDLEGLIGQTESIRREFKSGRLFEKNVNTWKEELAIEISALANTEGGELFIGIDEEKKKPRPRVAVAIDGVPTAVAPERLQQLIEGNVSPYLPGIRVIRVRLSKPDKVAFVVRVPQGNTAYQASDGRYYGRSEFEAKFLPDHEVRMRMSRGKVARGTIRIQQLDFALGVDVERGLRDVAIQDAKRELLAQGLSPGNASPGQTPKDIPDKMTFDFVFRNDGEITIRAPAIELYVNRAQHVDPSQLVVEFPRTRLDLDKEIIYPGDEREINGSNTVLLCKRDLSLNNGDCTVRWKVFLDNSPPSEGEIDLGILVNEARMPSPNDQQ